MVLKKCLHFISFYTVDTLYRIEFAFYFFLRHSFVLYWDMPSKNPKYVQCIKTKIVKFHIVITEMEKQ